MVLVDTNVLLDVVTDDPRWATWSQAALEAAALRGPLVINDVVYAELSIAFRRIEDLEALVVKAGLRLDPMPRESLFLAGKAFLDYRRKNGAHNNVLPDFFIGAHAAVAGLALLTRDARRYRTYFSQLTLIAL